MLLKTKLNILFNIKDIKDKNAIKTIYKQINKHKTSNTGKIFRNYLIKNQLLEKIIDFGHFNPFKKITTYPTIILMNKNYKKNNIKYYKYKENYIKPMKLIDILKYKDFYINNSFDFGNKKKFSNLKQILNISKNNFISVKHAISTNLDEFFLMNITKEVL